MQQMIRDKSSGIELMDLTSESCPEGYFFKGDNDHYKIDSGEYYAWSD